MKEDRKDNKRDIKALGTLSDAFNGDVSEELQERLRRRLDAFRQDLREHPYSRGKRFSGSSLWHQLGKDFLPFPRPLLLAGLGIACVAIAVFLPYGRNTPTWAEVAESFRKINSYYATFHIKSCDWCVPSRVEFWGGYGDRFRVLNESTVAFGKRGENLKAYNLKDRAEGKPDAAMQMVLRAIDDVEKTEAGLIEGFFEAHSDGEVVETTALVNPDPIFSKDLIVFDAKKSGGYFSIRLWALRESRLPVRILFRGQVGSYVDVIFMYSKLQPEKFFNPEAFETEMDKSYHLEDDLRYLFMEDPAEI
jgi:outer membrane lipoprotein-sorting protein